MAAAGTTGARGGGLDRQVARLATNQHGVVSRRQLLDLGLTSEAIQFRLRRNRLIAIHAGVYAAGHRALTRRARWSAAVLFGGPEAALSHRAAGDLHGLRPWSGAAAITVPTWRRSTSSIDVHSSRLPEDEVTVADGIAVTSVARTIFDLALDLGRVRVEQAIAEAEARELAGPLSLLHLLNRYPGRRGSGLIRAVIAERTAALGLADGALEEQFQDFVIAHGLPRPERNAPMTLRSGSIRVDCLWRDQRLIAELDGMRWHGTATKGSRDRARDRELTLLGYRVVRITWWHLREDPQLLAGDLRALLT